MRWLVLCLALMVSAIGLAAPNAPVLPEARAKIGDVLAVKVIGHPEFSGQFPVLSDGSISGTGFGRVLAHRKTLKEIQQSVKSGLQGRLKTPYVDVAFFTQRPDVVYILSIGGNLPGTTTAIPAGMGSNQTVGGVVPLMPFATLRMVLAGIPLPLAPDQLQVSVSRQQQIVFRSSADTALDPGREEAAFSIEADDVITIGVKPYVRVWVLGRVSRPGSHILLEGSDVYQAVAEAGGVGALNNEDYTTVIRRGPDSKLVPNVQTVGMLAPVLMNGDIISVELKPVNHIRVMGEVRDSDEYAFIGSTTLEAVIAKAGGTTDAGTLRNILVLREGQAYRIDISALASGGKPSSFEMQDKDVVVVQRNERTVSVHGSVQSSGVFFLKDGVNYRATDVIAMAGGVREGGSLRRVYLARAQKDGKIAISEFNLDEYLKSGKQDANPVIQADDVVLVGNSKSLLLDDLNRLLSPLILLDALLKRR
ncbi:MAG: SLBB domain-containing protein [Chthonomonas sp.]|nr:SLBB domain-containing protein [Chthonomonas sp.]